MDDSVLRIVVATNGVWSAHQLKITLNAIDGLACRLAIVAEIGDIIHRYEAQFTNWRAFGLLEKRPSKWGESSEGTEALVRNDYLEFANALRQHGIILKPTDLSWHLEFSVDDILELILPTNRLEIEFVEIGSPGLISLLMAGFKASPKFNDVLLHLINHLFHYRDMRYLMGLVRKREEIYLKRDETKIQQEILKIKTEYQKILREERNLQKVSSHKPVQIESGTKLQGLKQALIQAGCSPRDIDRLFQKPLENNINELCRLKCEGLITGIGVEEVKSTNNN